MKDWLRKLKKIKKLKPFDWFLLVKLFFCLLFIKIIQLLFSFESLKKIYAFWSENKNSSISPQKMAYLLNVLSNQFSFFRFTCLPKALVFKHFYYADIEMKLIIGVQKISNNLEAHAWVEKNGVHLIGDIKNSNFTPLWQWS